MSTGMTGGEQPEAAPVTAERHLRADAQRNRERILEAATTLMATHGIDVPIDEIAALAQVGVGTVYRNFPTKGALFEALLMARISRSSPRHDRRPVPDDPGDAFVTFVRRVVRRVCGLQGARRRDGRRQASTSASPNTRSSGELIAAVSELLERAQRAGRIRPDVTISDVSAMMAGLSHTDPSFMDPPQRQRCVALVCDSLLVGARSVLPRKKFAAAPPAPSRG